MSKTKNFNVEGMSFYTLTTTGPGGSFYPYFCIPPYQRNYTWDAPQVMQLLGDVYDYFLEACEAKDGAFVEKFIGAFILVEKETERQQAKTVYDVIDGQQRLTTLSLVIAAGVKVLLEIARDISELRENVADADSTFKMLVGKTNRKIAQQIKDTIKMLYDASYEDKYAPRLFREKDDLSANWSSGGVLPKSCEILEMDDSAVEAFYKSPIARSFFYFSKARAKLSNWDASRENYEEALAAVDKGEKCLESQDKNKSYKCNYELASNFLSQLSRGMTYEGDAENLPFNKGLADENQYDPKPMPECVERCVSPQSELRGLVEDLKEVFSLRDDMLRNRRLKELTTAALYVISYLDFLSKRVSIAVISGNKETALDIFETMNTAGQPLGCIETFIPEIYQTISKLEKNIPDAKQNVLLERKHTFGILENYSLEDIIRGLQNIFGINKNRSGVPQVVIWFSLICFGNKVGKNFQIQRSELTKSFKSFIGMDHGKFRFDDETTWAKIYEFLALLLFVGKWWVLCYGEAHNLEESQDVPIPSRFEGNWLFTNDFLPEELQDKVDSTEIDILNFCLLFLIRAGQSLSIAIIGRYYVQLLGDPSVSNLRELVKAAKAVAAFTVIWLSGEKGSTQYAETQRRTMVHEVDVSKVKQTPGRLAYFWKTKGLSGESVNVKQLQESFISGYIARNNSFTLDKWIEKLPDSELASMRKEVNRFLLLIYWHCSSSRNCYESWGIRKYAEKPEDIFLKGEKWNILSKLEVEHIVPQEPNEWTLDFDPNSSHGKRILNEIGNTTLLPKRLNIFASNKSWEYKRHLYDVVCASTREDRTIIFDNLNKISKKDRKTIENQLTNLYQEIREVDRVLVDSVRHVKNWNSSVIQVRTKAIASIVWPLLSNWMGVKTSFDVNALESLFGCECESKLKKLPKDEQKEEFKESLHQFEELIDTWTVIEKNQLTIDNKSCYLNISVEDKKTVVVMGCRERPYLRASQQGVPDYVKFELLPGKTKNCVNSLFVYSGESEKANEFLLGLLKRRKKRFEQ